MRQAWLAVQLAHLTEAPYAAGRLAAIRSQMTRAADRAALRRVNALAVLDHQTGVAYARIAGDVREVPALNTMPACHSQPAVAGFWRSHELRHPGRASGRGETGYFPSRFEADHPLSAPGSSGRKAAAGNSFVVTTGIGSGKSLCVFIPMMLSPCPRSKSGCSSARMDSGERSDEPHPPDYQSGTALAGVPAAVMCESLSASSARSRGTVPVSPQEYRGSRGSALESR